ncbi:MAG TPA: phage major capsid protein, partial [Chthonomonadaceae bacterium]|nr:phage major capsid protein [Chthonomonadaceae bacterium]
MDIKELQQKYINLMSQAGAIREKYAGKPETMTGQEETEFENLLTEADRLQGLIIKEHKFQQMLKWAGDVAGAALPMGGSASPGGGQVDYRPAGQIAEDEKKARRAVWRKFLTGGINALNGAEVKAYQADNPVGGGFLVAPQDFVQDLILHVKDLVWVRKLA